MAMDAQTWAPSMATSTRETLPSLPGSGSDFQSPTGIAWTSVPVPGSTLATSQEQGGASAGAHSEIHTPAAPADNPSICPSTVTVAPTDPVAPSIWTS